MQKIDPRTTSMLILMAAAAIYGNGCSPVEAASMSSYHGSIRPENDIAPKTAGKYNPRFHHGNPKLPRNSIPRSR